MYFELKSSNWYTTFDGGKARDVKAITVGNHPLVGFRYWNIWGRLEAGSASVTISTKSMEQRNGLKSEAAFWLTGADVMGCTWDKYMINFVEDIKKDNKVSGWTAAQSFSEFFNLNDGKTPSVNPWADLETAIPKQGEFDASIAALKKYKQLVYPVGTGPFGRLIQQPKWFIPKGGPQ
jgi:hypothetical protein